MMGEEDIYSCRHKVMGPLTPPLPTPCMNFSFLLNIHGKHWESDILGPICTPILFPLATLSSSVSFRFSSQLVENLESENVSLKLRNKDIVRVNARMEKKLMASLEQLATYRSKCEQLNSQVSNGSLHGNAYQEFSCNV